MQGARENFLVSGVICIVAGGFFSGAGIYSMGATIGVAGIVLFIVGMSIKTEIGMSAQEVEQWLPSAEMLPEAGKVMYRVDVTLGEPKKCSILCGACSHIHIQDGERPETYSCVNCGKFLWLDEEE